MPSRSSLPVAGKYAPSGSAADGGKGNSPVNNLGGLVNEMKTNFLQDDIEIFNGLKFNQYQTLRRIHFYLNSEFEEGSVDSLNNEKYFHNIINHRNAHATKNIDLDTKDMTVTSDESSKGLITSWLLRQELYAWMRDNGFAAKLNQLSEDLPRIGSVVWKKQREGSVVMPGNVDLRNLINDPTAEKLSDNLVAERHLMTAVDMRNMEVWDKDEVEEFIKSKKGSIGKDHYMKEAAESSVQAFELSSSLEYYDVYELWGWVPESLLPDSFFKKDQAVETDGEEQSSNQDIVKDPTKFRFVLAQVGGVDKGGEGCVLYLRELDPEDFPYKEVHMRRMMGRWLGVGNTEMLFSLQVRMNELVNRFFQGIRLGTIHLYQTRDSIYGKNLWNDAQDGDIIETKSEITPIPTDLRAFYQYHPEANFIDALADKICNTFEVVTGESLPAGTPFRLGAQLGSSAGRIFDFIREQCGIFLSDIFNEWILPSLAEGLNREHVLEITGSVEDIKMFDEAYRRSIMFNQVKEYVLKSWYLPTDQEFQVAEQTLADALQNGERKVKVETNVFEDALKYSVRFSVTDENNNKKADQESLGNVLQILASNPAILQDPNLRMLVGRIMELNGMSPLKLAGFISAPAVSAADQARAQMDAAAPAMKKFSANPGDAGTSGPTNDMTRLAAKA